MKSIYYFVPSIGDESKASLAETIKDIKLRIYYFYSMVEKLNIKSIGSIVWLRSEGIPVPNNSDPLLYAQCAGEIMYGKQKTNVGNKECETLSGDAGLQDIIQIRKQQSEKMEKLGLALKIIPDGKLWNTPFTVKSSVGEAAEVLGSLPNTHKSLMQSEVEIQKRLEELAVKRALGEPTSRTSQEKTKENPLPNDADSRIRPSRRTAGAGPDAIFTGPPRCFAPDAHRALLSSSKV